MPQLPQGLGFDLADAFTGHGEVLANFFQGVLRSVFETEPHLDDAFFAWSQRVQNLFGHFFQVDVDHRIRRRHDTAVFDEVTEMGIFFLSDRCFQRYRFLCDLEHLANLGNRDIHALGDLFTRGLAAKFLNQSARSPNELVDRFDHVDRNTDRPRLIGDCTRNGLADPPCGIG